MCGAALVQTFPYWDTSLDMETAVVLIQCPDKSGIVATLSDFVFRHDGNIISSDQYSTDPEGGRFYMRLEFSFDEASLSKDDFEGKFAQLAGTLDATYEIHYGSTPLRMGILCSKQDHCLNDLLYLHRSGDLPVEIPLVVSNHPTSRELVEQHGIPFHHIPITKETKPAKENEILGLVKESTDFLVLARYMQIISEDFLRSYKKDIINIHHSFLPSFKGANPYRQAYERGVKIIGATAHFATVDLDEGPIIEQIVGHVSHKDTLEDLKRRGRSLEKMALADAIRVYVEHRVIRFENKTIVFQ